MPFVSYDHRKDKLLFEYSGYKSERIKELKRYQIELPDKDEFYMWLDQGVGIKEFCLIENVEEKMREKIKSEKKYYNTYEGCKITEEDVFGVSGLRLEEKCEVKNGYEISQKEYYTTYYVRFYNWRLITFKRLTKEDYGLPENFEENVINRLTELANENKEKKYYYREFNYGKEETNREDVYDDILFVAYNAYDLILKIYNYDKENESRYIYNEEYILKIMKNSQIYDSFMKMSEKEKVNSYIKTWVRYYVPYDFVTYNNGGIYFSKYGLVVE